jgi:predicted AlkP superfamily pyrophosphatase or phosphodiesterase
MRVTLACVGLLAWTAEPAQAAPVLMISIDGLRPGDVLEAQQRGLKVPNLRRFVKEGASATGVRGVLPTVTYPSHATLLTGTSPARHGVVGNTTFDPMQINQGGWYWYAAAFQVPTLWDVARQAGLTVGNVHWPVSVGAKNITWSLPQIWRTGHSDDADLLKAVATPGLIEGMEARLGAYPPGIDESIGGDENRGKFAVDLIDTKKPDFMTVYLTALDHEQHASGPGTAAAHAILERIDAVVGKLMTAEMKVHPDAVIAIVSDHGFSTTDTEISLFRAFIDAGLITLDGSGKIVAWLAMPWPSGGSAAIILAQPDDTVLRARVAALLAKLQSDKSMRIAAIADKGVIAAMDGNPQASFYVDFERGAYAAGFKGAAAPLSAPSASKGMHGYFPASPEMRSTFLIMGKGIPAGKSVGEIDMRAIAPTLAARLGVTLKDAEVGAIDGLMQP